MPELAPLLERFRNGDRLALSRLLSLAARGEQVRAIVAALDASSVSGASGAMLSRPSSTSTHNEGPRGRESMPPARLVAITGSAGVGKSTLIGKLIELIRKQGRKVAVLACDPQSPLSGGALLGDRFRMPGGADDDGVFIRSLAALSGRGAVAEHLDLMARLLGAFGFDVVLVETVGAGQGDVTVSELADVVVLLLQPETGDDLQWEKAGVLEVADVIGVQKADLPRAEHVAAQVRAMLELGGRTPVPVVLVSAKSGQGVAELWQQVAQATPRSHHQQGAADRLLDAVRALAAERLAALRRKQDPAVEELIVKLEKSVLTPDTAADTLLRLIAE